MCLNKCTIIISKSLLNWQCLTFFCFSCKLFLITVKYLQSWIPYPHKYTNYGSIWILFIAENRKYCESIWIKLIIIEIENSKHYSKFFFKCVNSAVGSIFNIFKCVNSACTVQQWILSLKVNNYGLKINIKKEKTRVCKRRRPIWTASVAK